MARTNGAFYFQRIAIKFSILSYAANDEVIDGHPHRATPVAITPKEIAGRIPGIVLYAIFFAIHGYRIGVGFMVF